MKKIINKTTDYMALMKSNTFITGSAVMMLGTNFYNVGQLVYHVLGVKLLGKSFYGDLAAFISIFAFIAIIQLAFGLTIIKFIASEKKEKMAQNIASWIYHWGFWSGLTLSILAFVLSPFIISFLHISESRTLYLFAPTIFFLFLANIGRSILQGLLKFTIFSISLVSEISFKIIFTLLFLYLGYALFGAMVALTIGTFVGFLTIWFTLRNIIHKPRGEKPPIISMLKYSLPVFIQGLAFTSMYSVDVILVKHFFTSEMAGAYAGLARLGSIAFFISSPIAQVMFTLIAQKSSQNKPYIGVFYTSILLISSISLFIVFLYSLVPKFILLTLFDESFIDDAPILKWFGIYSLLIGLASMLVQFYLSIGKTKVVYLFVIAAVTQIALIILFHASLLSVIQVSILTAALLVTSLLIYFPYHQKHHG